MSFLNTPVNITTVATVSSLPETYPIIVSGGISSNYDVSLINGTLTVVPAQVQDNQLEAWFSGVSSLQVSIYSSVTQKGVLQLLNVRGHALMKQEIAIQAGANSFTIPCNYLPAGAYIARNRQRF